MKEIDGWAAKERERSEFGGGGERQFDEIKWSGPAQRNEMTRQAAPLRGKRENEIQSIDGVRTALQLMDEMNGGAGFLFLLLVGYRPEASLRSTIPFQQFLNCFHFSCFGCC